MNLEFKELTKKAIRFKALFVGIERAISDAEDAHARVLVRYKERFGSDRPRETDFVLAAIEEMKKEFALERAKLN
jgi:hypothetical protein